MSWLIAQSLPTILLSLALGLVMGRLVWGRRWERVRTSRGDVLGNLVLSHQREVNDRDAQIRVLRETIDEERAERAETVAQLSRDVAFLKAQRAASGGPEVQSTAGELPADAAGDDLQRIEGVGPKMAAALRAAGLDTFDTIADSSTGELQAAVESAGLRFAPSLGTWPQQARLLAIGDVEGHERLTSRLVAGRGNG